MRTATESVASSIDPAEVVSKGGLIHDNVRQSQIRRDAYLKNLMLNRVSEKTGVLSKAAANSKAMPLKVRINEHYQDVQKFESTVGRMTLQNKAASIGSSEQTDGRI